MWHEARKQERKIRGMIVDYRKRAERRQDFYERIKADPAQFIQTHGRKCKIHLDQAVAAAGDGAAIIVPWQGNEENLIDRFDVRAHLDVIPIPPKQEELPLNLEERHCNYERYRILGQNEFLGISEDKFLYQLRLEEQFGATVHIESEKMPPKKKLQSARAAISYSYETKSVPDPNVLPSPSVEAESDSDLDMDVTIDVNQIDTCQAHELNSCGRNYGMTSNDFFSFLTKDAEEALAMKMAKEVEQEKIMLSGRKSRRERRVQREKRLSGKPLSPPSYAAKEDVSSITCDVNDNDSDSHSHSSESSEKITFITSFGGEDELQAHSKIMINMNKQQSKTTFIGGKLCEKVEKRGPTSNLARVNTRVRPTVNSKAKYVENSNSTSSKLNKANISTHLHGNYERPNQSKSSFSESKSPKHSQISRPITCSPENMSPSRKTYFSKDSSTNRKDIRPNQSPQIAQQKISCPKEKESTNRSGDSSTKQLPESTTTNDANIVPIKRYYGRKRDNHSSSSNESSDSEMESKTKNSNDSDKLHIVSKELQMLGEQDGKSVSTATLTHSSSFQLKAVEGSSKQNLRDRLKRKMQTLLNRQYKADKKAEMERTERQIQQQQEREDEMRELALKLRKRQRELRHKYGSPDSESSSSSRATSDEESSECAGNSSSRRKENRSRSRDMNRSASREMIRSRSRERSRSRSRERSRSRTREDERKTMARSKNFSLKRLESTRDRSRSRSSSPPRSSSQRSSRRDERGSRWDDRGRSHWDGYLPHSQGQRSKNIEDSYNRRYEPRSENRKGGSSRSSPPRKLVEYK